MYMISVPSFEKANLWADAFNVVISFTQGPISSSFVSSLLGEGRVSLVDLLP